MKEFKKSIYLIYKKSRSSDLVIEFIAPKIGTVIVNDEFSEVGHVDSDWIRHDDNESWQDWTPPEDDSPTIEQIAEAAHKEGFDVKITLEEPNPYQKPFTNRMNSTGLMDVYDVLNAFEVTDPMIAHAVKKLLVSGGRRGGKSEKQDIEEARWSIDECLKEVG